MAVVADSILNLLGDVLRVVDEFFSRASVCGMNASLGDVEWFEQHQQAIVILVTTGLCEMRNHAGFWCLCTHALLK